MPLYRWSADSLKVVTPTTFESEGLQERSDLQRLLRDQPGVLEEGLFIVAEEYGNWEDSNRSIDLLALDAAGYIVVIELKRTRSGDYSELQAIRYAAMVSNMRLEQIVDAHAAYLSRRSINEDARLQILNHLGVADEADAEIHTGRPRIILASAGFSTELTTSVLWLRDVLVDIRCVKLQLYRDNDGLLMDANKVIPLPETEDFQTKFRERQEEQRRQSTRGTQQAGAEMFKLAIESAQEKDRAIFQNAHQWAVELNDQGLAELMSTRGTNRTLNVRVSGTRNALCTFYISETYAPVRLWGKNIRRYAPESILEIEAAIGTTMGGANFYPYSEDLLEALYTSFVEANEVSEANGLPPTTPPPDTAPDSLPPAE